MVGWRSPCGACAGACAGRAISAGHAGAGARMRLADGARADARPPDRGRSATRTVVHGAALVPLPAPLPPEQACLIGCAVATGVCSVLKTAAVWEGARVGVIGCGAVGLSVFRARASRAPPRSTRSTSTSASSRPRSRFGATHLGDAEAKRLDFVFDWWGGRRPSPRAWRMLGYAGTLYIGLPQPGSEAVVPPWSSSSTVASASSSRTAVTMSQRRTSRGSPSSPPTAARPGPEW